MKKILFGMLLLLPWLSWGQSDTCPEHYGCIDFTDLGSCHTVAKTGTFNNPDSRQGVVDYGSDNALSRHTVNYDTAARDPRTGGRLRLVPEGEERSVRLGNWRTGGEEESLTYRYKVDTNLHDLLILRYAVVFQSPNHPIQEQPRMVFRITDSTGREVDGNCYSAVFMANDSLGWNVASENVLWKDWTTVGVDLTSLHGQTINVYLSTYDCKMGSHYAYSYFVIKCADKVLTSTSCGNADTVTLIAPEGFSYHWYRYSPLMTPISTTRTLFVNGPGVYHCRMTYLGSVDNPCTFTMTAYANPRYPKADFVLDTLDTLRCSLRLRLHNRSVICHDEALDSSTGYPCERCRWTIDDTIVYHERSPWHYFTSGTHKVVLEAMLADGKCSDTAVMHFSVGRICNDTVYDTLYRYVCESELPVTWDSLTYHSDSSATVSIPFEGGDSIITYFLHVVPTTDSAVYDTVMESQLPWTFMDTLFSDSVSRCPLHTVNEAGCDSIVYYNLYVFWDGDHCDSMLQFPNVVTANGDGTNDRFVISGLVENQCYPYNLLIIYDRTGRVVFRAENIIRDDQFWDPAAARMPAGTYFYFFQGHGVDIQTRHYGCIEVLR